jgi:hypothetical protein
LHYLLFCGPKRGLVQISLADDLVKTRLMRPMAAPHELLPLVDAELLIANSTIRSSEGLPLNLDPFCLIDVQELGALFDTD